MSLVGLNVDDENQGIVLLDLFHRTLGIERVNDDLVLVETGLRRNRLAGVFWGSGELKSLRLMERCRQADLADFLRVRLWMY